MPSFFSFSAAAICVAIIPFASHAPRPYTRSASSDDEMKDKLLIAKDLESLAHMRFRSAGESSSYCLHPRRSRRALRFNVVRWDNLVAMHTGAGAIRSLFLDGPAGQLEAILNVGAE